MERRPPLAARSLTCALALTALGALALPGTSAGAPSYTLVPVPPLQAGIDLIDESVEGVSGVGVATLPNDNPTTWVAEDGTILGPGEEIIYRLHGYDLQADALDCAAYELDVTMGVRADGPQLGLGDNMVLGVIAGDTPIAGATHLSPDSVGGSTEMQVSTPLTPEQLRDGLHLLYGATTHQGGIMSGYTMSEPGITITEDLSGCDSDGDGTSDDVDPDTDDVCVPDADSTACVESRQVTAPPETEQTTTTTTPSSTTTTTASVPPPGGTDAATASPVASPAPLRPTG